MGWALLLFSLLGCGDDGPVTGPDGGEDARPRDAAPGDAAAGDAAPGDAGSGDADPGDAGDGGAPLPALPDMTLGPYPSAHAILLDSLRANAEALDTGRSYPQSAAQGYVLQAIAALLRAAHGRALPGGEAERDELVALAAGEIDELMGAAHRVVGGGPAFGLDEAWDAFGDGSSNPAFTPYAWQSGMVALGIAEVLRYLDLSAPRHDGALDVARVTAFLTDMLELWNAHYRSFEEDGATLGFFWYSTEPADAKAVHNTSALLAMASALHAETTGDASFATRPPACAELLRRRVRTTAAGGYAWNYVDDGYPVALRSAEDVSHALVTLQLMRFARERDLWSDADMARVATTILRQMWTGHPALLNGRVDGTPGGDDAWTWSQAAVIGLAVHGDAPGGRPEVFEHARSLLVSSYMTPTARPRTGATVDSVRALAVARLFEHRPAEISPDSLWSMEAGPGDDARPTRPGGVRFYVVDWAPPVTVAPGDGLDLVGRTATAVNANLLVDLEDGDGRPVVVSITYRAASDGAIEEWDGTAYHPLAPLPASRAADGVVRWMRTTLLLDPAIRFDYEPGVPGRNVLLQITSLATVHRIEATPISR